jgi:hypothetical protein
MISKILEFNNHYFKDKEDQLLFFSLFYLALPCIIFLLTFITPIIGVTLAALILYPLIVFGSKLHLSKVNFSILAPYFFLAFAISMFFGVGYFGFQTGDHEKNQMIFKELFTRDWPVIFSELDNSKKILSYPLGFFLSAAYFGRTFSWPFANFLLYLNSAFGLLLLFFWLYRFFSPYKFLPLILFFLFGGIDIVGEIIFNNSNFSLGTHIEWWAGHTFLQYSSFPTVMSWNGQHFAAQFIGISIIYELIKEKRYSFILYTFSLVSFWSHLTVLGYIIFSPLFLKSKKIFKEVFFSFNSLSILLILIVFAFYTSKAPGSLPYGFIWNLWNYNEYYPKFFSFYFLEYSLLSYLIWLNRSLLFKLDLYLFYSSILLLSIVPFFSFGWSNDFSMRVSGPALFLLFLITLRLVLKLNKSKKYYALIPIITILVTGSISSASEIYRQVNLTLKPYRFHIINYTNLDFNRGIDYKNNCLVTRKPINFNFSQIDTVKIDAVFYKVNSFKINESPNYLALCFEGKIKVNIPESDVYRIAIKMYGKNNLELNDGLSLVQMRELIDVNDISSRWVEQYTGSSDSLYAKYLMR